MSHKFTKTPSCHLPTLSRYSLHSSQTPLQDDHAIQPLKTISCAHRVICHIITLPMLFTSFAALICCFSKRTSKYVIISVDIPSFKFPRRLRTNVSRLKRIDGLKLINHPTYSSLLISLIRVLSTSVTDLLCYKARENDTVLGCSNG